MHSDASVGPALIRFRSSQVYGILDRLVGDTWVFGSLDDLLVDMGPMSLLSV